jgi:hypothetical protein
MQTNVCARTKEARSVDATRSEVVEGELDRPTTESHDRRAAEEDELPDELRCEAGGGVGS